MEKSTRKPKAPPHPVNPQVAQAALQFLERVQLSGSEVPAFVQVRNALAQAAQPPQEQDNG